jgi:hypothetical protein
LAAVVAVTAEAAVAIAPAPPQEPRLFVLAAASKLPFLLNPEAIVRYSAAIASRRKRVVPVAAVAGVDAATTAAAVAAVATNSLH